MKQKVCIVEFVLCWPVTPDIGPALSVLIYPVKPHERQLDSPLQCVPIADGFLVMRRPILVLALFTLTFITNYLFQFIFVHICKAERVWGNTPSP